jgi:hypothetical protein
MIEFGWGKMKKIWSIAAVVLAGMALCGCATFSNPNAPEKAAAAPPPGSGIVILSTGAKERCISMSTHINISPVEPGSSDGVGNISVDDYIYKSDFPDHQGNVSVVTLRAGRYVVFPTAMNPFLRPVKTPQAEFAVDAGEIVYIGEFYMPVACSSEYLTTFNDRSDRDLALVRTRNPAYRDATIVRRIAKLTGNR